jgi:hypothetical protein
MVRMVGDSLIVRSIGAGVLLCALASGCAGTNESATPTTEAPTTTPPTETTSPGTTSPTMAPTTPSPTSTPPKKIPRTFDPKNFGAELTDVNRWLPMAPGIQSVSKGFVYVGGRRLPHIKVTTVTDVTKMINGVRAVLVLDQDFDGGQLSEQSIDYLAEDVGGNVWYVGSYTEAYEGGQFLNAEDAWLAGVNGAAPGLYLPAIPKTGTPPYYQVQIPGGEQSTAQVAKVGQRTCVPFKCYTDVVVVLEGGSEHKYWAPGVGGILTEPLSGAAQETEELVNIRQLSPGGLAELSAMASRLDRNAAAGAPSVFGGSKPAKRSL